MGTMGITTRTARGWRMLAGWLLVAATCLCLALPAAATPLRLTPGDSSFPLAGAMAYWHDTNANATPEQAFARAQTGGFAPLPGGNPAFGFQTGAYWFHLSLENLQPEEPLWILVQEYALSDHLDLYLRYPDGRMEHSAGGDHVPFGDRFIRYRHPNFRLDLPAGQRVELLLRVQSESSMQVPLSLYTPKAFAELLRDAQFSNGLYYGIVLALLCYNLVLWLMLRDASYFWYLLHTVAFGLVLFALNGYGFEYLWPNSVWLADASIPLSICFALIGMQLFARSFLDLRTRWPVGDKVCLAVVAFFVLLGAASTWLPYSVATPIASRAVLLGVLWIIIATLVMLRRGYQPARLFLLAWSLFLAGTAAFTLLAFGVLPQNFWTQNGVQIGSALELLLLSLALGKRYASLREENVRLVQETNEKLERGLIDRTRELRTAMAQLGEANVKLLEYSRRDPLTGTYNRRYFHEAFTRLLEECGADGRTLGLLLLDLDHFKRINDRHGHQAGDACLVQTARSIEAIAHSYGGLVARFGGEEFVVLLPCNNAQEALQAAEGIRLRIQQNPVVHEGHSIHLSASIGLHTVAAGRGMGQEDVIRMADAALYRAKDDGRNCVRHSLASA
ncbi:7TM diverse intracellular signaling domain-containing protein [Thermomonas sp.]|uniref:sensor domain-containing diguanylate cyclase n=1 Tax=Thermomonas sp. TaxID=1971895 RepID=UPI00391ACAAB